MVSIILKIIKFKKKFFKYYNFGKFTMPIFLVHVYGF